MTPIPRLLEPQDLQALIADGTASDSNNDHLIIVDLCAIRPCISTDMCQAQCTFPVMPLLRELRPCQAHIRGLNS